MDRGTLFKGMKEARHEAKGAEVVEFVGISGLGPTRADYRFAAEMRDKASNIYEDMARALRKRPGFPESRAQINNRHRIAYKLEDRADAQRTHASSDRRLAEQQASDFPIAID